MDINLTELPNVIYACFVLHNFCDVNNERMGEVASAIDYNRSFQPAVNANNYRTDCNEVGKKIRRILTQ